MLFPTQQLSQSAPKFRLNVQNAQRTRIPIPKHLLKKNFLLIIQKIYETQQTVVQTLKKPNRELQHNLTSNLEITLRFVDSAEMKNLNFTYRGKDYATNVLTFTYRQEKDILISDIILCMPTIEAEALSQKKNLINHLTHLIIHGTLHAFGYDHESEEEAALMEQIEIELLEAFEIENPYFLQD